MKNMDIKYPDWAPSSLVNIHRHMGQRRPSGLGPDALIEYLKKDRNYISDDAFERLLYRRLPIIELPLDQRINLLRKILTDERMRNVWENLSKRNSDESKWARFWFACESAITGWKGDLQLSGKKREEYFREIHAHAIKLSELIEDTKEFQLYSVDKLIDIKMINYLLNLIDAIPPDGFGEAVESGSDKFGASLDYSADFLDYVKFTLSDILPSVHAILSDIAVKALEYGKTKPMVGKPNSENAELTYFIRRLSEHMQKEYGQPLHELVATTAYVVFEKNNIDATYVRKITNLR